MSLALSFLIGAAAQADETKGMRVLTPAKMPSAQGPVTYFTGSVKVTTIVELEKPSNLSSASVSFEPSARSAWHVHPRGQILVVTDGSGLIQEKGKPVRRIQKGDVIWTPPGVTHWHGASPESAMTHIATQEGLNGKVVEWMEKVSDQEYKAVTK